jgi:hypothetical protein
MAEKGSLVHQLLNGVLNRGDLTRELLGLAGRNTGGDNGPGNIAGTTKSGLGRQEDVRDVLERKHNYQRYIPISERENPHLLFAKEGKMEQDLEGFGVSSHDDEFCDTTVESLGSYRQD